MKSDSTRIHEWIETLSTFTESNQPGYTRFSYTQEDVAAKKYLIKEMKRLNLAVSMDYLGNIFGRREGLKKDLSPIMVGSHIDTVKNGGKYDGLAGIATGLEIIKIMEYKDIRTNHPIEVVAFSEEEGGRFNSAFLGSKWFAGKINEEDISQFVDINNIELGEAIKSLDVLNDEVVRCKRKDNHLAAMIELHCEQGTVLENNQNSLGIVSTITGSSSFQVELIGEANHAGTIPMGMRKDAFFATSMISVELNRIAKKQSIHSVGTIGNISIKPNAYNIIPGEATFIMDIRSLDQRCMEEMIDHIRQYISEIAQKNGLIFKIKENHMENPVNLSDAIKYLLVENAEKRNYSYQIMGSGAGHDAIIINDLCPSAMVFVPSKDGRSHCKEEYSKPEDIAKGSDIILDTVLKLEEEFNNGNNNDRFGNE